VLERRRGRLRQQQAGPAIATTRYGLLITLLNLLLISVIGQSAAASTPSFAGAWMYSDELSSPGPATRWAGLCGFRGCVINQSAYGIAFVAESTGRTIDVRLDGQPSAVAAPSGFRTLYAATWIGPRLRIDVSGVSPGEPARLIQKTTWGRGPNGSLVSERWIARYRDYPDRIVNEVFVPRVPGVK